MLFVTTFHILVMLTSHVLFVLSVLAGDNKVHPVSSISGSFYEDIPEDSAGRGTSLHSRVQHPGGQNCAPQSVTLAPHKGTL